MTNGTDEASQTVDTSSHNEAPTEAHAETSDAKQSNEHHEASHVETSSSSDAASSSEGSSSSEDTGDYEIFADDRGRVTIGYWDDEGYWNPVYEV